MCASGMGNNACACDNSLMRFIDKDCGMLRYHGPGTLNNGWPSCHFGSATD